MRTLRAFLARSFQSADNEKIRPIQELLESFRPLGFVWETAERAELESVSKKVQQKIDECDVFVGVFTRRYPIFATDEHGETPELEAGANPVAWTAPPWLFQESGYALKAGKKLLLIREKDVELPGLQGDLEYIEYDPKQPQVTWTKANQVLTSVIAHNAGIATAHVVSGPEPKTVDDKQTVATEVALSSSPRQPSLDGCFEDLLIAYRANNLQDMERAEAEGVRLIQSGTADFDEVSWRSLSLSLRGRSGDHRALQRLQEISAETATNPAPFRAIAQIARAFGEHKIAGDWLARAAAMDSATSNIHIESARDYRVAKQWDLALKQLESVFKENSLSDSVREDALKEMFWLLKETGDQVAAFCFGEAALRLLPNDSDFRFQLAYAYGNATGGYTEHDYRDLALFHYRLLARTGPSVEYARNNLGVVYNHFELPINATEQFKADSGVGNALATANVVRQYLLAGFVDNAQAWADSHKPITDPDGNVPQALAAVHSARVAEETKIQEVIAAELPHREALAGLAQLALSSPPADIDGKYQFPIAIIDISRTGDSIVGAGKSENSTETMTHRLSASYRNKLWHFEMKSKKEGDYYSSDTVRSYGLLAFTSDGQNVSVLEYSVDGVTSHYTVARANPSALSQ
jgi:hypothetical protein